jgi:predicted nucleic acid-binding protein
VKKRVLVDTNVVLDVLLDRPPHVAASAAVCAAVENGKAEGLLAADAVTTIRYPLSRKLGEAGARHSLHAILKLFGVAPVDGNVLQQAIQAPGQDFEDSVTASAAHRAGCHLIVTRDPKGFRHSPLPALDPPRAIALLR